MFLYNVKLIPDSSIEKSEIFLSKNDQQFRVLSWHKFTKKQNQDTLKTLSSQL